MRAALTFLVLAGLGLAPDPLLAESLQSGERVRVTFLQENRSSRLIGLSGRLTTDSLFVRDTSGQMKSWPWESVTYLERSLGRRGHAGTGALVGGAIGLGVGAFAGATAHRESQFFEVDTGGAFLIAAVITGIGVGLGALTGSMVKSDRWQVLPPEQYRPATTEP